MIRHLSGTLLGHGDIIIPKHGRRVHDDHALARQVLPELNIVGRTGWPKWNGSVSTRLAEGRSRETSDVEREESTLDLMPRSTTRLDLIILKSK